MIIVLLCLILISTKIFSQSSGETLSIKIATKMADSLSLTSDQKGHIYDFNMQLHNQKMSMRQLYKDSDSLRLKLQGIEKSRDSLYHTILSDDQYQLYISKKKNLVNNN